MGVSLPVMSPSAASLNAKSRVSHPDSSPGVPGLFTKSMQREKEAGHITHGLLNRAREVFGETPYVVSLRVVEIAIPHGGI